MSKEKILGYKIRHSITELYLSSVSKNKWTKIGKTWPRRCDAIRAINMGLKTRYVPRYGSDSVDDIVDDIANWDLIELKESGKYSVLYLIDKIKIGG